MCVFRLMIFAIFGLCVQLSEEANLVCYFTSWTIYRPGNGKYSTSNLPANLCTHINYGFVGLSEYNGAVQILDDWEANGLKELQHLVEKKKSNPNLKILVSMGGWNEGSAKYSHVAGDPNLRKSMVSSVLQFLQKYNFDGFDLDWEYPAQRGGRKEDIENFIVLLQELKTAFSKGKYLLSVAVSGGVASAAISYDFLKLGRTVDMINVMAYDYHGAFEPFVGHYSPLYASHLDKTESQRQLNVFSGIKYWLQRGVPPSKINLGVGTYGRCFTLADAKNISLYAPTIGNGCRAGPYTRAAGTLGYNEICELYKDYKYFWDDEQQVPHIVKGDQWIGYDDVKSIELKVNLAKSLKLGGMMVWSLDTDDFLGICGKGQYPLINNVKKTWIEQNISTNSVLYDYVVLQV